MRRGLRTATAVVGAGLIAASAAVAAAGFGGTDSPPAAATDAPPATTTVTRMTLTQTVQVNGTLGYGSTTTVTGRGHGTVTWLPAAGTTVHRGQSVYRADNLPVPLWYGDLPLYRTLRPGVADGPDVKEVEQNLAALGYTGFTVDETYTSATASAVRRWQQDLGLTETGTVDPSAVVLAHDAIRVATLRAALGDQAGGPVLTYTDTTRVVTIPLDVSKQDLVKPGVAATVTLPDGRNVSGTVHSVGSVATAGSQGNPATIDVTVQIADQSGLGTLDQAPADVTLVSAKADNVLTVPVAALVALAEGGYGVQVVTGSTTRYVAVRTGMFANGRVEVSGPDITAGTVVGVPK
jgi:peptidoglycan hydrolase-like protein with peptidoglycan-binding domain